MAALKVWNVFVTFVLMERLVTAEFETCVPTPSKCVCYGAIGCFTLNHPFNNSHGVLPKSPEQIDVQAQVFTRSNHNDSDFVNFLNKTSLEESCYTPGTPTKFVIHGFANTIETEWLYQFKDELLKKEDVNVFIITWGPGAAFPDYNRAVANTRVVARMLKLLLNNLVDAGSSPDSIHLIGHSLGAHISGVVGSMLRNENITLGRISGLDPAEPDFLNFIDFIRLSKDDAQFVDVIHTDGQPFNLATGYGMYRPSGHVDFYINGGEKQPDCKMPGLGAAFGSLFSGGADAITTAFSCSHSRAHEVYLESINSLCPFTAYPCESYDKFQAGECLSCGTQGCTRAGYSCNRYPARGQFYLNTREKAPFCGHHYKVSVTMGTNPGSTKGHVEVKLNGTWGISEWLQTTNTTDANRLGSSRTINHVVVTDQTIGYNQSINVMVTGSGRSHGNISVKTIDIEAGESGLKYKFCINRSLQQNSAEQFSPAKTSKCT